MLHFTRAGRLRREAENAEARDDQPAADALRKAAARCEGFSGLLVGDLSEGKWTWRDSLLEGCEQQPAAMCGAWEPPVETVKPD